MTVALTDLVTDVVLRDPKQRRGWLIDAALADPPQMLRTIDGASTLTLTLADPERKLVRSKVLQGRLWADVGGLRWELVQVSKSGSRVTLVFEDSVVGALRRRRGKLSIPGGTTNMTALTQRFGKEAGVPVLVDPGMRAIIKNAVTRSTEGQRESTWEVLGSLAEDRQLRRFSNGRRLVVGSDKWLRERIAAPRVLREHRGAVHDISFDLDVGKRASTATVDVDAGLKALVPGEPVILDDMGPADGRWLVSEWSRALTSHRATVTVTRPRRVLPEPPLDGGETDYLPGVEGSTAGGRAATAAREKMVQFALAQDGKAYVWGGNGPSGYDCSGLVQAATAAAGKTLTKPSKSQWSACVAAGRTISVQQALGIRGALLFRMTGEPTHVAISLGNGSTVEARGTAYGCGVFGGAASRGWTGGAVWV